MSQKFLGTVAAVALMAMSASSALAVTVTIDLNTGGDATNLGGGNGTFSSGGITGSILAGCDLGGNDTDCDGSQTADIPLITISNDGMGVRSDNDASDELDENNRGEFLTFTFDFLVNLLEIDFRSLGGGEYDLLVNGLLVAGGNDADDDPWTTDLFNVSSFTVIGEDGGFWVRSFDVERVAAPVPLPAGGLLLIGALGGLAALRRRKTA